jgi:hypothetical protein
LYEVFKKESTGYITKYSTAKITYAWGKAKQKTGKKAVMDFCCQTQRNFIFSSKPYSSSHFLIA